LAFTANFQPNLIQAVILGKFGGLVSDGLSAEAVHHHMKDLLPVLLDGLAGRAIRTGQPILARYGRVKLAEPIADALQADLIVHLIGNRLEALLKRGR